MSSLFRNNRITTFAIVTISMLSVACSSGNVDESTVIIVPEPTAKDIIISELSDPCQCVDAMLMTVKELADLDLESDSSSVEVENLLNIEENIEKHCIDTLKFSKFKSKDCENFEKLEAAFDSIKPLLKL